MLNYSERMMRVHDSIVTVAQSPTPLNVMRATDELAKLRQIGLQHPVIKAIAAGYEADLQSAITGGYVVHPGGTNG